MKSVILTVAIALAMAGQQRYTSRAEAVRVDVLVTDGGRTVRGLTAANFELRDNGVPQSIAQFERERLPLNVIAVLDTSGSVAGVKLQSLIGATGALLDGLTPIDKAALLTFAGRVVLQVPLTARHDELRAALGRLEAGGRTALRDAAFAALTLRERDNARTLVLLFSDGADTASWLTAEKVIEAARRADVVVYPVAIAQSVESIRRPDPRGAPVRPRYRYVREPSPLLDDLAQVTGGRVMTAGFNADLHDTFVATLAEFRERYVLSYQPSGVPPGSWHQIDVRLKGARGKVAARRGYFAQ